MTTKSTKSPAALAAEQDPSLREAIAGSELFSRLQNGLRTVTVDGEVYYKVEGDMLLDEAQLAVYARQREALEAVQRAAHQGQQAGLGLLGMLDQPESSLLGIKQGNRIIRWKPGLKLSYCVLRQTFLEQANYDMVRANMQRATTDWQDTCGVEFEYKQDLDKSDTLKPKGVLFTVRELDTNGEFIAAAFFPNDPLNRRIVLIDPTYYADDLLFDRTGVLRHELGHVLGFRHEHIRTGAPPACPDEDIWDVTELTPKYDPRSVMHYFCGHVGSKDLAITDSDRTGAQMFYGPPLSRFRLLE